MNKIVYFSTLLLSSTIFAHQLHNYEQIKVAVSEGKLIRIYTDYTKCNMLSNTIMVGNHDAVYTPNAIAITNEGHITSYLLYFTMNDPHYPTKAVYQYVKYSIASDNYLHLTFNVLNAADYTPLGMNSSMDCKIDTAVKVFDYHHDKKINMNLNNNINS
jgi:VirK protein